MPMPIAKRETHVVTRQAFVVPPSTPAMVSKNQILGVVTRAQCVQHIAFPQVAALTMNVTIAIHPIRLVDNVTMEPRVHVVETRQFVEMESAVAVDVAPSIHTAKRVVSILVKHFTEKIPYVARKVNGRREQPMRFVVTPTPHHALEISLQDAARRTNSAVMENVVIKTHLADPVAVVRVH